MYFVKNALDFFKQKVVRIRSRHNQVIEDFPDQRPSRPTFRTYELGGDPFNDRIEFHLTDGGSGFGDPVPDGEARKPARELTEEEIMAAFGCPPKRKD